MGEYNNKALSAAVLRLLRPLVRLLLRHGVSYGVFSDLVKWVYIDVADKEFNVPGRKQTVSRVSVLTGLSRKEVSRVQKMVAPDDVSAVRKYNRAARVLSGWLRDMNYQGKDDQPLRLSFDGDEPSFSHLVRKYSGDMPVRAVLDELVRVKTVEQHDDGMLQLVARAYIPSGSEAEKLHILGTDVADLVATIDHNLYHAEDDALFQRKVSYDNLPAEVLPALRKLSREKAQLLLEEMNDVLAEQDRDVNPDVQGIGRKRAGLAIYYFEDDVSEEN